MSKVKLLIHSRKYIRKSVTEIHNKKLTFSSLTSEERCNFETRLQSNLDRLRSLDSQIQSIVWEEKEDEDVLDSELKVCEEYEIKAIECLTLLQKKAVPQSSLREEARSLLKSPTAPLPKFTSAEGEDVDKFFLDFEETINKFSYEEYDKLLLLRQQVSGRALLLLNSLETDKQGYTNAKKLLLDALASPETKRFNVIKKLTELKLDYGDEPFEYIAKMKTLTESATKLNLDRNSFLQYFFWQGLNESFKTQFVQLTNSTRPSLQELNEKFFEVTDRYEISQKKFKNRKKNLDVQKSNTVGKSTTGLAVNVKCEKDYKPFKPCSLCSNDKVNADHPIFKCSKYDSAKAKIERLKGINGCLKCSNLNHDTQKCKFHFNSRCRHCNEWHFSFLCLKFGKPDPEDNGAVQDTHFTNKIETVKPSPKSTVKSSSKSTSSNIITITEALQSNTESESILPTFTCRLNNLVIRALKDGGCQSNFISEKVAKSQNLKVLRDNICLTVNGINISQQYNTCLVEVELAFGDKVHKLEALCIPSINISLELPNLSKVVDGFVRKGFPLADEKLLQGHDNISEIDFILGTKSSYCIPDSEVLFGQNNTSLYAQTPVGIMLKGDTERLIRDLSYLPHFSKSTGAYAADANYQSQIDFDKFFCTRKSDIDISSDKESLPVSVNFCIISKDGKVNERELEKATNQQLQNSCSYFTNYDNEVYEESSSEKDDKLVKFCIDHTSRDGDGRLVMPLLWNSEVSHLLGKNQHLSTAILESNRKKLVKNPLHLKMMDDALKEQEQAGIIERLDNLQEFLREHPEHSFIPHMGVFKMDRETTKCRVVFLSNLCEKDPSKPMTISHNQAMYAGPSLNQKVSSALLHLRFDSKLLCFDIKKAFNNIALNEVDSNKLLFLWYRNVQKGDFSIVGYRNVRLSFGLRCSPTILLLGLYKILILDAQGDSENFRELKKLIYQLCYMDNCAVSANNFEDLRWSYEQLDSIFDPYHFGLQQFVTNDQNLQNDIDLKFNESTPEEVKLFGILWDRSEDVLFTKPIQLDNNANTKRSILSSIASQFDLYNFNGPILNRSRLFMHELQCNKNLGWDDKLSPELQRQWKNIVKQANSTPHIKIKRFVGYRNDKYKLVAFCDSSKLMFGTVIFILNLRTSEMNFIMAKNRIVNKQLENKSIPSLELQSITLATKCLIDLYEDLSGSSCIKPIDIVDLEVYSDSLVALSWLNSYSQKLEKMNKRPVFVMNRIYQICKLSETFPIKFSFISGAENPADAITRSLSYRQLMKTNFFSGPDFENTDSSTHSIDDIMSFTIPNPLVTHFDTQCLHSDIQAFGGTKGLALQCKFSSFQRMVRVCSNVLEFVKHLKSKLVAKDPEKFKHLKVQDENYFEKASRLIILWDQHKHFPEIFRYFDSKIKKVKDIPNLVKQLNIYIDSEGLLRVRSKCDRLKADQRYSFPLLLSKDSQLTPLIVMDLHKKLAHAGCYSLLSELRKRFWIPHFFSVVKKILRSCTTCRRFNDRTIKLNQSQYRDFRINPPSVPYRYIFVDYLGPFYVKLNGSKAKVWILCITCMFTRAINLKICIDQSVKEFLRAFQLHSFEFGIPEYCISDLGTQIVAASNIIADYIKDPDTKIYFEENGVKPLTFDQFFKGCSKLGSMVESCVKLTKRLIHGAVKTNILSYRDFDFIICQTVHIVNRRPIAFKEALRDSGGGEVPEAITPESLIRGYDLLSLNIIPDLHRDPDSEWDPSLDLQAKIKSDYHQLQKVRNNLIDIYHSEFLANLVHQAVNIKDRYKPVTHKSISKGDIVLIKEQHTKPVNYPMGRVINVTTNVNNEVTGAEIIKGKTKEKVFRHSSVLIPLLTSQDMTKCELQNSQSSFSPISENSKEKDVKFDRPKRKAAVISQEKTKNILIDSNLN